MSLPTFRVLGGGADVDAPAALDGLFTAPLAVVFKHSPACPISADAHDEVTRFLRDRPDAPVYLVDVVRERPLSRAVAERTGVVHESPQVIVLKSGAVTWHASHHGVTAAELGRRV